ncbi:MAG: hypothetical protein Q8918_13750 [Bacteroidota bacterium]|nr:hypothetical protein [Bacteroidota bacterium]MDP4213010.1 hypothetical protein [Bacteroidota bacterium]MDP4251165.1 hypothetical protein [Bacteroidota bacterium]
MKLSRILPVVLTVFFYSACHNQPDVPPSKKNYFPVRDYLRSQIADVDSVPSKMMEYDIQNGKTDSAVISLQTFNKLAAAFLLPDLDSVRFENRFEENSFLDQSNNLLTFTYSTKDSSYGLRRVDVLATPNPGGTDKVKSIYLESSSSDTDGLKLTKMYWRAGKSFSIIHIYQPAHGETGTSQTNVVWDSSD